MANYDMANFTNATNLYEMFDSVNSASGNWLVYMAIIAVFIILLLNLMRRNPPAEAFTGASAVTSVFTIILLLADLVSVVWVVGGALLFAMSAVGLYLNNKVK